MKNDNRTKGLVPKLRFPEFRDAPEWKIERLSKISSRVIRKVGDLKVPTLSISAGKGFVTQTEKFGRNISGAQYKNYILLEKGDFAYNKGNSKQYPQGCIYQLEQFDEAAVPNAFICFCFRKNYVAKFFLFYFENNCYGEQLKRYITSGARSDGLLNISADDFFSILIPVSEIREEQQKIADCLSSIDELIKLHSQKLELLKDYKKGLMQQLFPAEGETVPKLRFPEFKNAPEWEKKKLADLCNINPSHGGLPTFFFYIDLESVVAGHLISKRVVQKDDAPSRAQRLLKEEDVIYQIVRPYQKNNFFCKFNDKHNYVASTGYAQLRAYDDSKFLFQIIHTDIFVSKVIAKCTGSSYPAINTSDLSEIRVTVPKLPEQQKIADCLSSIDELITSQTRKIESLREHKKGLMQQLFPSAEEVSQ
jgi:type I restriction enzyme S subunit